MKKLCKLLSAAIVCLSLLTAIAACDDVEGRADSLIMETYRGETIEVPIRVERHTIYSREHVLFDSELSLADMSEEISAAGEFSVKEERGYLLVEREGVPVLVIAQTEGEKFGYRISDMAAYMEENGECNYTNRLAVPEHLLTKDAYRELFFEGGRDGHLKEGEFYGVTATDGEIEEFYSRMGFETSREEGKLIVKDAAAKEGALAKFEITFQGGAFCEKKA